VVTTFREREREEGGRQFDQYRFDSLYGGIGRVMHFVEHDLHGDEGEKEEKRIL